MSDRGWRRDLRSAVLRGDGPAVVALLAVGSRFLPDDALQLVGDGLHAGLIQQVDGAADLARLCVGALRDRAWYGDDDLADELDAALGTAAGRVLVPLPVDLEDLAEVLEGDASFGGGRIDRHTGEVWHGVSIEYAVEIGDEDEYESENSEHWLWVQCEGSHEAYRDMARFIDTIDNAGRADRLDRAIRGRGAFRRFKDQLARWPDELERWYAFSEERQRGRARAWLASVGYRVTPAPAPHPQT